MKNTILSALLLTSLAGAAQAQVVYNFNNLAGFIYQAPVNTITFDDVFIPKTLLGANGKLNLTSVTSGIYRFANAPAVDVSLWAAPMLGNNAFVATSLGTPVLLGTVSLPVHGPTAGQFPVTIATTQIFDLNGTIPGRPNFAGLYFGTQFASPAGLTNNFLRMANGGTIGENFRGLFYEYNIATAVATGFGFNGAPAAFAITLNGTFSDPITSNPAAGGVSVPNTIDNDLAQNVVLRVTVSPGQLPLSTGLGVTADASVLVGGSVVTLLDNGIAPDATAGDNIFTVTLAVAANQIVGAYLIPFTVTETNVEARTATNNIALTVTDASGSCCLNGGATCEILLPSACAAQLGTFNGTGSICSTPDTYTASSAAAAFENISTTGTPFIPDTGNTDDGSQSVALPFANGFNFYGTTFFATFVNNNGALSFFNAIGNAGFAPNIIPSAAAPNGAIFGWWQDLDITPVIGNGTLVYETRGTAGVDLRFIAQWTNAAFFGSPATTSNTFQIVLFENGNSAIRYGAVTPAVLAADVTVGIEDATGAFGTNIPSTGIGAGNTTRRLTFVPSTQACFCTADVNKDGVVDGQDFIDFINAFGVGDVTVDNKADVNKDLIIDGGDFILFINSFGAGC